MDQDVHEYAGEDVEVTYDVLRCIHARECVRGLPAVFDPDRRPWIEPESAGADELADVIERCPTGALHYERRDGGPAEVAPEENAVTVVADGPHYVRGDVDVETPDGDVLLSDTRVALCRCGETANRPLCDGSHRDVEFEAPGTVAGGSGESDAVDDGDTVDDGDAVDDRDAPARAGPLSVTPTPNGPLQLEGEFEIRGDEDGSTYRGSDAWLCRCGGSNDKPFCDGTHARIGFRTGPGE